MKRVTFTVPVPWRGNAARLQGTKIELCCSQAVDPQWSQLVFFEPHLSMVHPFRHQLKTYLPSRKLQEMGVSKNRGTPKSSILIGFSIINHPFWEYQYFWKHPNAWKPGSNAAKSPAMVPNQRSSHSCCAVPVADSTGCNGLEGSPTGWKCM